MAAILQFRQGSKTSFISSGPYISEPFFDTDTNIIHIGVSGSSSITLTKLEDINSGSFSVSGDISGSNLYLSGDITASNTLLSGDITIGGNIILGDQVQDNITVSGQFDSDLIPSASLEYDLGSTTKKWNVLYASRVDATELTGSIQVTNTILPDANEVYDLGSPTQRFRDFYISSGSLRLGNATLSSPDNGNTVRFSGPRFQIGGLTGGRIEYNPTRSFLNLKGPSTDTSIPIVSSRMYLTGSNGEGYLEMGGDSNTMRFGQGAIQLGGNTGGRIRYNNTSNRIHFQGPTTDEPIPVVSSKVILSGSNGEINLEVGADGNLSSSNSDGSQTVGIYSGSFSGDGSELTFGGTDIISSSAQLTLLGYDGYFGWSANADNSNSINISSGRTLYFEGGDGITTETRNPGNYYITIDLDTGSAHFTDAVAGVGAPQGTVSGSQQVIDLLPSGTVSGSSQVINILDSLNTFTSSQESKNTLLETHTGSVNTSIDSLNSFTNSFDTAISLNSSDVTILGNLTVQGTQTQLNTATLNVEDLNILLASGSTTSAEADGAGITIDGANKSLIWNHGDSNFLFDAQVSSSVGFSGDGSNLTGLTADSVDYENILNKPTLVSGSSQITYSDIDSIPQNIVSSSTQITAFLPSGTISGSSQLSNIFFSQLYSPEIIGTDVTDVWNPALNRLATTYAIQKFISDEGVISGSSQISLLDPFTQLDPSYVLLSTETYVEADNRLASTLAISKELNSKGLVSGSGQLTPSLDLRYLEIDGANVLSSSNETFSDFSQSVDLRLLDTLSSGSETSQSLHTLVGNFPTSGSLGTAAFYNVSSSLADDPNVIPNVKAVYDYINNTIGAADITGVSASLGLFGGGNAGYVSLSLDTASLHFQEGVELYSSTLPSGVISSSAQIIDFGFLVTSSALYNDQNNLAIGTNSPTNLGATQFTINDSNTAGTSGLISFTDSDVLKSYDYVYSNYRYVDTNSGVGIVLKPDSDSTKSWVIDTDGDLVSNGGDWASGNIYANKLIASSSVTASYILVDEDITANNFIGSIQATNGVVSSSQQITDFGFISESNSLYTDANDFSFGGTPQNAFGLNQITIRDDNTGYSGLLAFQDNTTLKSYDYVASNYRYIDTNTGVGIVLKPDADGDKSWVIDTDGDLVSNGGSWASGNAYMNNLIASSSVTASNLLVDNDINTNNLTAGGNVTISGNLTVSGTTTYTSTNNLNVGDNIIELNYGGSATTGGILVKDATAPNTVSGSLLWDGTNDYWKGGPLGSEKEFARLNSSLTQNTVLKANASGLLVDSNISDDGTTITLNSDTTVNGGLSATDITASNFVTTSELEVGYAAYMDTIYRSTSDTNVYINLDSTAINFGLGGTNKLQIGGTETRIYGNLRLDGSLELGDGNTVNSTAAELNLLDGASANTVVNSKAVIYGSAGEIAATTVSATGDIVAYASSDRRLKDEITQISNPIEKISQIGGYSFVWNSQKQNIYKGKDYGVIAQEIEEILPELVDTRENGYKAVKYDRLVSLLIEGIKELSSEVKELKEKINRE